MNCVDFSAFIQMDNEAAIFDAIEQSLGRKDTRTVYSLIPFLENMRFFVLCQFLRFLAVVCPGFFHKDHFLIKSLSCSPGTSFSCNLAWAEKFPRPAGNFRHDRVFWMPVFRF
jgi:hypothetical protein